MTTARTSTLAGAVRLDAEPCAPDGRTASPFAALVAEQVTRLTSEHVARPLSPGPIPAGPADAPAIAQVLDWVRTIADAAPLPGSGHTRELWEGLATAASADVGLARALEPHLDARAILDEANATKTSEAPPYDEAGATWGVFAAEGPEPRLTARFADGEWRLNGVKPWCSLAGSLSHALVTAWVDDERRGLFVLDLRDEGVTPREGPWLPRGFDWIVSAPIDIADVTAIAVGEPGWYLTRPGFAWGGIGVAAAWWGAALPLAQRLRDAASRDSADQLAHAAAGEADALLWGARAALADAAASVDGGVASDCAAVLAARVRAVVVQAVERTLDLAEHALGPGPLSTDEDFARRVADLRIYVRQDHGARDLARLGRLVAR